MLLSATVIMIAVSLFIRYGDCEVINFLSKKNLKQSNGPENTQALHNNVPDCRVTRWFFEKTAQRPQKIAQKVAQPYFC
jgi:hypothetical protein